MYGKIDVLHNLKGLEYDIYGLFKAFLPELTVKILMVDIFNNNYNEMTWTVKKSDNSLSLCFYNMDEVIFTKDFELLSDINDKNYKTDIKRCVYFTLAEFYNKTLPWGTLTGIRPIKLITEILNSTQNFDKAFSIAKDEYLISEEKVKLSVEIAKRQRPILNKYRDNNYSLYISVPFCPTICSYCSFSSGTYKAANSFIEAYIDCLCKEIEFVAENVKEPPCCIYIGGGTPSGLDNKYIIKLFNTLEKCFDLSGVKELTFEAGRPDSFNKELFETLKGYNITRLSINPQTMNDKTLKKIGRSHNSADIIRAFDMAVSYGYDNINSDIIIGLPDEEINDLKYTLDTILELPIKSLTVHSLSVKKGSKLKENLDSYNYIINKNIEKLNELCINKITEKNMMPYYLYRQKDIAGNLENIGYSYPSYEGIYNVLILEEKHNIIGVGAGAVSKLVRGSLINRIPNIKDALLYTKRFDEMIDRKSIIGDFL